MASMSLPPPTFTRFSLWVKSHLLTKNQPPPADLSLKGQTALITGANSGLGLATAKVLLQYGLSRLVITCRNLDKGHKAAAPLRAKYEAAGVEILVWELDMLSYDSIQRLAKRCQRDLHPLEGSVSGRGLDIAILSAGVAQAEFELDEGTGHEVMMQTNYLSTALLAFLLLPALKAKRTQKPGRLTIVASAAGLTTTFACRNESPLLPVFDDREWWDATDGFERYGLSKTLVLMLLAKLGEQELVDKEGNAVTVNALEPGLVTGSNWGRTPEQGAWMYTHAAAVVGDDSHGAFLMNWDTYQVHPFMYTPEGKQITDKLWDETLKELEFAGVRDIIKSLGYKG